MNIAIDCYKLIKGDEKTKEIYDFVKRIIELLSEENLRRDKEHHIMVIGNSTNQDDYDKDGISFLLMDGDPLKRSTVLKWELIGVALMAPKLCCDKVFFPCGRLPLISGGKSTVLLVDSHWKSMMAAKSADRVIVLNDEVKNEIVRKNKKLDSKIRVLSDLDGKSKNSMEFGNYWKDLFAEI